jgi:hypothetical protein
MTPWSNDGLAWTDAALGPLTGLIGTQRGCGHLLGRSRTPGSYQDVENWLS